MRMDARCVAYTGVALLIGFICVATMMGFAEHARGQRESRLLSAEGPHPTESYADRFARGYAAYERQEKRDYSEDPRERRLQGYRKKPKAGNDTDIGVSQEVAEEETEAEEVEKGRGKRASKTNGSDGDEESLAVGGTPIQEVAEEDTEEEEVGKGRGKRASKTNGLDGDEESLAVGGTPIHEEEEKEEEVVAVVVAEEENEEETEEEEGIEGGGKRASETNGADGVESIAETMTRTQLKLRPPPDIPVERTQSTGIVAGGGGANPFPYNYPKIRYVPWHDLSKMTRDIVGGEEFGYNVVTWNYMSHDIEGSAYSALDPRQQKTLLMLGIDENVWDCFINRECVCII